MSQSDTTDSEDTRLRDGMEAAALAALEVQIAELAEKAATGAQVDADLARIIEAAPESVRVEIVKRFQELHDELHEGRGIDEEEITPEMEAQKRLMLEREHMMMGHWLSQETLKKIRRAMLMNPLLYQQIVTIGQEMSKRGVFFDARRAQVTSADIGAVTLQPDLVNAKEKDTGRDR